MSNNDDVSRLAVVITLIGAVGFACIMAQVLLSMGSLAVCAETAVAGSSESFDLWGWFMTFGPKIIQVVLILALCWNVWQRSVWKSAICLGACFVTFILGW